MKIADFGLSLSTLDDDGTYPISTLFISSLFSSPEYMKMRRDLNESSPSGMIGITTKSDIYSLGIVFYQFLTKTHHPFESSEVSPTENRRIMNNNIITSSNCVLSRKFLFYGERFIHFIIKCYFLNYRVKPLHFKLKLYKSSSEKSKVSFNKQFLRSLLPARIGIVF